MKVLLVDDHPLFLEGLQNLMSARGIEVVGTAANGLEALKKAGALEPDVILMDVLMPCCNGLAATRLIKAEFPDIKIVMLTTSEADDDLFEAVKSGASGYLLKNLNAEELFSMLEALKRGEAPLSSGLAAKVLKEFDSEVVLGKEEEANEILNQRQMEVLSLVAQGKTYKEVAESLYVTERTVKYHMGKIIEKLHMKNRAQVIAYASHRGLVDI
ncbi:MAG: chemotaxis protein CheY [Peptococcaceae bacterium BICA1-7]|nr:MAG: chemotaxis protein CheY [Peptococcaceae bacterium BICA1-7]HBV99465.1 DNA-binding response regulator [Desulfotomaculum sp.]